MIKIFQKKPVLLILFIILILASWLRFYKLSTNPPSLNWDETAIGYNAHSILKTGKDEFGSFLPLSFRSLDDYKMPVYIYLTSVSIIAFGYNDFAVRFPSAIAGVGLVLVVYFLTKELIRFKPARRIGGGQETRDTKLIKRSKYTVSSIYDSNELIPLLAAFFVAILPWNIQFSRMASEANLGLFFLSLAVLMFVKGIKGNYKLFSLSVLFFGISSYSYLSYKIIAPLIGLSLIIIYYKKIIKLRKTVIYLLIPAILIGTLMLGEFIVNQGHVRFSGTNAITHEKQAFGYNWFDHQEYQSRIDASLGINIPRRIYHDSGILTSAGLIIRNYLTHFSPTFLVFDYSRKVHHVPFVGLLYIWFLPLIIIGMYWFARNQKIESVMLVFLWLLFAPVAAGLTWDVPHVIRSFAMSVPLIIFAASGWYMIFWWLRGKGKILLVTYVGMSILIVSFSAKHFYHQYMIHLPLERSQEWIYGRREMSQYLERNCGNYNKIIVSYKLEWPYIFMLYYSKYDPAEYLSQGGTVSGGWEEGKNKYDNYEFRELIYEKDKLLKDSLLVGSPDEFPGDIEPLYKIDYLDGEPAILFFKTSGS